MAVDYFLKIDGVPGESTDKTHVNTIEMASFSWGGSNAGNIGSFGGGGGAGKVSMQDFHFVTKTSKASPTLFLSCCTGDHLKTATIYARKAGKVQQEFLKITLSDCIVSSFQSSGGGGNDGGSRRAWRCQRTGQTRQATDRVLGFVRS